MTDNFTGLTPRDCTLHRNGIQRAWCFDCGMWCYPQDPCHGCQRPIDRRTLALYKARFAALQDLITETIAAGRDSLYIPTVRTVLNEADETVKDDAE